MANNDYLFLIQRGVQDIDLDEEVAFFRGLPGKKGMHGVEIIYAEKVAAPVQGVVAIVRFGNEADKAPVQADPNEDQIEAFCHAVRDHVADDINKIMFDNGSNVLTNGNGKIKTKNYPKVGLGFTHLTKWAHASMANVVAGLDLGSYGNNGSYDPNSDKNSYAIGNLEGGSGGKH